MTAAQLIQILNELDKNDEIVVYTPSGIQLPLDGVYEINRHTEKGGQTLIGLSCNFDIHTQPDGVVTGINPVYISQRGGKRNG